MCVLLSTPYVRNKTTLLCEHVLEIDGDIAFLTETLLKPTDSAVGITISDRLRTVALIVLANNNVKRVKCGKGRVEADRTRTRLLLA